ncbi:hypothetical protein CDD80_4233 [Ophiocordyceps camponoti-rufipedis]|uniref:RING-type domain-containing protein n=1 Tax=Ophiocordyceps camponoti-rufipedis TaxID=2004952 RepID=A0A2C5YNG6_9HYPO|nr:hypothetical protein CDD80_4233 [Ophiocordyceps camponoti-rufipedis]
MSERPPENGAARHSASDSSDEGLRMSPAAARRFARRNLHRTSATPDLVTSLVRPPSPDAFYVAPGVHARRRPPPRTSASAAYSSDLIPLRPSVAAAGSDRRSGPLAPPHPSSLDIPARHGGTAIFDLYSLNYVADSDPCLVCPICHDPLVDPVTTPCDHTFCYRCLRRSIASSPSGTTCPIDRDPFSWLDCFTAARLVRTQLNALIVRCPHSGRGCSRELRREVVERHATTECRYKDFACPDAACTGRARTKGDTCPHAESNCSLCDAKVQGAEVDVHLLTCPKAKTRCQGCWQLICRSQLDAHRTLECDGVEIACPHQDVGCPARALRGDMGAHARMCSFHPDTPPGIIIRAQRELLQSHDDLSAELRDLRARQTETDARIDELMAAQRGIDPIVHDKRTMQDLDAGFEEVHQNLTQLEARQSMWTMNQVMPIREEVTELRNNINMIRMHVNWLLNRSREEGRIRAANNTGSSVPIRSVSSGDGGPALPERRRSSATDMDLPRL